MVADLQWLGLFTGIVAVALAGAEGLRRAGWPAEATRRLVHCSIGLCVVAAAGVLTGPMPLYALAAGTVALNGWSRFRSLVPSLHAISRRSQGTMVFPLALLVVLASAWADGTRFVVQLSFLVLAVSDPLAGVIGRRLGRTTRFIVGADEKSLAGSAAFLVSSFVLVLGGLWWLSALPWASPGQLVALALVVAVAATVAELLGQKGWDNLTIVVAVAAPLVLVTRDPAALPGLVAAVPWALGFTVAAWRLKLLDVEASLAAGLLGLSLLGLGGWAWAAPGLVFFAVAALLSGPGSRRTARQVYANGALAWVFLGCHVVVPHPGWYWAAVGAFAAAAADTWATGLGTLSGAPTLSLVTGKRVSPGLSGGVSLPGTLAAFAGAATVFAPIPFLREMPAGLPVAHAFVVVVAAGVLASLADSALGGTVQALYRRAGSPVLTEEPVTAGVPNQRLRGAAWIDDAWVNVACTAVGAVMVAALA